jgi:precorrin-8X/cobalt-precorrin-8 methylmutase
VKPQEIEAQSFKIIDAEAGPHGFSAQKWRIVQRMIHTSADFEYIKTIRFHPEAIEAGINAISKGKPIFTDTNMARAGIRKKEIDQFNGSVQCLIMDPAVSKTARETGVTRARVAVDAALTLMEDGIYVIGNAPTALLRLIEQISKGRARPALVVGLPVGFVNAAESKSELVKQDIPYISNAGRKGGSNVAAAVINALAIMAAEKRPDTIQPVCPA